jgi:colanic acid biosynthesis glycosyl transferase WcaI
VRLLFVTHYFYPEVGAPQTRILEAARALHAGGHEVTVLTGFPNYPDGVIPDPYRRRLLLKESLDGIKVVRSAVYPAPNRGFARRLANHASSAVSAVLASSTVRDVDALIAETPPLFTAVAGVAIARSRRAPLVLNVADLWPESAVQLGILRNRRAIRLAEALERFAYAHASAITVPTPGMRQILLEGGQPPGKVVHLPNAVDVDRFVPPADGPRPIRRVLYCGTVGMAQGVGTLLDAAQLLGEAHEDLTFEIVGDGAERGELEHRARALGLRHVTFAGRIAREQVPDVIAASDVTVMSLRDLPLFGDALPTKLLEYMAAAKPVVAAASGQVSRLVEEAQCGIACPPEDPEAMATAIRRIAADPRQAHAMGTRGRRYVETHLSRPAFVACLEDVLEQVTAGHRR